MVNLFADEVIEEGRTLWSVLF